MSESIHGVRDKFNLDDFLKARELSIKAVDLVSKQVEAGMSEKDGHNLIDSVLNELGCEKKWHPNKFRIGTNTIKSFSEKSDDSILKENDIFFVDIGPVFNGHEGDYGSTFVLGENSDYLYVKEASTKVFSETAKAWKEEGLTGIELYKKADQAAQELGLQLNHNMSGHRVGDFPHQLFYRGGLNEVDESPCDNLWVLEIHVINKENTFGAFFEDILKK